jgi:hypothetical protein
MVTEVVVDTAAHPPEADVVYVTMYVPGVLVLGLISPVVELILKPVGAEKVPVEKALVPDKFTVCAVAFDAQKGEA